MLHNKFNYLLTLAFKSVSPSKFAIYCYAIYKFFALFFMCSFVLFLRIRSAEIRGHET